MIPDCMRWRRGSVSEMVVVSSSEAGTGVFGEVEGWRIAGRGVLRLGDRCRNGDAGGEIGFSMRDRLTGCDEAGPSSALRFEDVDVMIAVEMVVVGNWFGEARRCLSDSKISFGYLDNRTYYSGSEGECVYRYNSSRTNNTRLFHYVIPSSTHPDCAHT